MKKNNKKERWLASMLMLLLCSTATLMAQVDIKGVVVDVLGEPIIGANIIEVGTSNGITTDIDGNFAFTVSKVGAKLQVSYIGYKTIELPAMAKFMSIIIEEDSEQLEEVVVVGYGITQRKNFSGSVTTVKVGEGAVSNLANTNALDMLRGLTTGVSFSQSGVAGSSPSIQVRGQKSINGGSDPLIVLNGVIYQGSINDIDPASIESMSVLKDATTLAAYGSQAANGVIMITTKKGQKGKPMINFKSDFSWSEMNYKPELRDAKGYVELMNDRNGLEANATSWMSTLEKQNWESGNSTDWWDLITQTGFRQNYSLSVGGASDNTNYMIGGSWSDITGVLKGNEFFRTTIYGRITTDVNKYISVGLNFNYASMKNDGVRPSYTQTRMSPLASPYLSDGVTLRKYPDAKDTGSTNPLWSVESGSVDNQMRNDAITVGGEINVKIPWIKGLSYKLTGNYGSRRNQTRYFQHENYYVENLNIGEEAYTTEQYDQYLNRAYGYITQGRTTDWVMDHILTYTNEWDKHFLTATLVYTRDSQKVEANTMRGEDFSGIGNTTLGFYGLTNAGTQSISNISYTLKNDIGYLGRINYSYDNTYHLNVSVRRDGSSVFGSENKWGIFPAVGLAWTISNESFMKRYEEWLGNTKLKLSWGKNGNQSLDPYGTLSEMSMGRGGGIVYYVGGQPVYGQELLTLGNPTLAWETTTSWNYGLETDLFKGKVHFEIDAYNSRTTDQIFDRNIPSMGAGIDTQKATMGQVNNWGIESSIRYIPVKTKNFEWNTTLTFTINRNKLKELYGDGKDDITSSLFIGKSLGAIYGYNFIGIVQDDAEGHAYIEKNGGQPGDAMYEDLNGDGVITPDDRKILGYNKENFRMSWANNFRYKNWSLYFLFNGIFSGGGYGMAENNLAYLSYESMAYTNSFNHPFWTAENPSTKYPRSTYTDSKFTALQSYGFVRLQDLNLGYTFSGQWMKKAGIGSLQVYASAKNLFCIAPGWDFSDPEVLDPRAVQLPRSFTLGLNVRF